MSNAFSKEEIIAWEQMSEGFENQLVMSKNVTIYNTDQTTMERTNDVIWRPQPYIMQSHDGTDATGNFDAVTQLTVPATIGYPKYSAWEMSATELRDALQEGWLGKAAEEKLASDINTAVMNVASLQGTMVIKRTVAATGFDDVALLSARFSKIGVPPRNRVLALDPMDANGIASNLAGRQTMNQKPTNAYEEAYIGRVSTFDTFTMDTSYRLAAAAGGGAITMSTLDGGGNFYTPESTSTAATGEVSNVDNRYQTITVSSTASVAAGDAFTVATLDEVHMITKQDTGQLKTFRVISVDSGTTMTISPPMITAQGGTDAELQYQNCIINTKAANSALVFLNTTAAAVNPFWFKDAIELLPGRYAPVQAGTGAAEIKYTSKNGIQLVLTKQFDINTRKTKYRVDTRFGVVMKNPEMAGIVLFNQA